MVNQASLTGESAAVFKQAQGYVYARTVLMVDFSCALKQAMPISVLSDGKHCRCGFTNGAAVL
ncbi:hypothetical protein D3Z60_21300 [Lachnospiraceae bacterium]|jgi:cation transport ATPase|nr:hypothetical protein [Lachnospiraceae bacterium]